MYVKDEGWKWFRPRLRETEKMAEAKKVLTVADILASAEDTAARIYGQDKFAGFGKMGAAGPFSPVSILADILAGLKADKWRDASIEKFASVAFKFYAMGAQNAVPSKGK